MAESRRKFDQDFKEGAVRLVNETGKPIAQIARDLGVSAGTLAHRGSPPTCGRWLATVGEHRRQGDGHPGLGRPSQTPPPQHHPARPIGTQGTRAASPRRSGQTPSGSVI
ncbi:transposase [Actinomadura sp. 6N118]|uniref:transposase n=1 Tax=Actinomadura sp. 6N118 TaxID=3375151 RepID=UPI0037A73536